MRIYKDAEFERALLEKIAAREFSERTGTHSSDLIYCLPPETRVLRADLHWVPIGSINVGDSLVSIDEFLPGFAKRRKIRKAVVVGKQTRKALTYKVLLSDGRTIRATSEHLWLSQTPSYSNTKWRATIELKPGFRVRGLCAPWQEDKSYWAGYVAGGYDGEGSAYKGAIFFSQKPNEMLDLVKAYLDRGKYPYYISDSTKGVRVLTLSSIAHTLRFLGTVRPSRLINKEKWWGLSPATRLEPVFEVVSVTPYIEEEVVGIETDTHTYNAEGIWTHNCLNKQSLRRLKPKPNSAKEILLFSIGWATQRWLTGQDKDEAEMERDGIIVTMDALWGDVPWELKATYQSSNRPIEDNVNWVRQIMSQCYVKGALSACLSRFEIMGDWKIKDGNRPTLSGYKLEFTQEELDRWWEIMKRRRDEFNKILETGRLMPRALAVLPAQEYECGFCSYKEDNYPECQ